MQHAQSLAPLAVLALTFLTACAGGPMKADVSPEELSESYQWLEEVEGERALKFVREQNEVSLPVLKADPRFSEIEKQIRTIILAKDRLPLVRLDGEYLYNFWQDEKNVRGIWRRTTLASYRTSNPKWETLLDLDALSRQEKENWVWTGGAECLLPSRRRCLISLSRGGKDASVVREFDLEKRSFVKGGFELPEAKSIVDWIDQDQVYVATDFGPGTLTDSGYPRVVKLWKRGTPLASATEVARGEKAHVRTLAFTNHRPEGRISVVLNVVSFFEILVSLVGDDGKLTPIGMPRDSSLEGFFHGRVFYSLRSDLKRGDRTFKKGSVVAFPLASVKRGEAVQDELEIVFEPSATRFFKRLWLTKDSVLVEVLDNVMGKVLHLSPGGEGRWLEREIQLVGRGRARVYDVDPFSSHFLASFESFDTPLSLFTVRTLNAGGTPEKLKSAPARFDASNIVWTQRFTTSRDGTKVPYFILHRKDLALNGKNPTLLYGYGGFENAMMPSYMGVVGKVWLEKGGVFALANIRGGDEYGPGWHQAALRENRQNAFDDFVAIAEDLVNSKITSPSHLGIQGGSNGGLLTSVAFTQRPDLFGAVVSSVPLTDMLRYHKLLAGASWMHEYGNPEDTKMRDAILRYSPLHNLRREKRYPEVFFITSTKDDRVHPAHARKMVARLRELGHPVLYYENIEGGHGAAANLEQRIFLMALEYTYLWKKLGR